VAIYSLTVTCDYDWHIAKNHFGCIVPRERTINEHKYIKSSISILILIISNSKVHILKVAMCKKRKITEKYQLL